MFVFGYIVERSSVSLRYFNYLTKFLFFAETRKLIFTFYFADTAQVMKLWVNKATKTLLRVTHLATVALECLESRLEGHRKLLPMQVC